MSFWSKIGDAVKSVGKGIINMIPGFAISTASNAIGGAMSAKDAKRQHQYDLEKMATQHGYNIESQKLGQQFNKEMWDCWDCPVALVCQEIRFVFPSVVMQRNRSLWVVFAGPKIPVTLID